MQIKATGISSKSSKGKILEVFFLIIDFDGKKTHIKELPNYETSKEIINISWGSEDLKKPISDVICSGVQSYNW